MILLGLGSLWEPYLECKYFYIRYTRVSEYSYWDEKNE